MGWVRWWGWVWVKGEVKGTRVRVGWEVKVGFHVNCRVWGGKSGGGENWAHSMCKIVANSIVNSNFADARAFEKVIAKNINHCATCTDNCVKSNPRKVCPKKSRDIFS